MENYLYEYKTYDVLADFSQQAARVIDRIAILQKSYNSYLCKKVQTLISEFYSWLYIESVA